jgi:hypothetical protein
MAGVARGTGRGMLGLTRGCKVRACAHPSAAMTGSSNRQREMGQMKSGGISTSHMPARWSCSCRGMRVRLGGDARTAELARRSAAAACRRRLSSSANAGCIPGHHGWGMLPPPAAINVCDVERANIYIL